MTACIEEHLPHIGGLVRNDLEGVIADVDVLVVGLNDKRTVDGLKRLARPDQVVLDLAKIGGQGDLKARYVGLTWR